MRDMQLSVLISISPSPPFPPPRFLRPVVLGEQRDPSKLPHSFSSRTEDQGGQASQQHSEKVLLSLEEVKVSGRFVILSRF